MDWNGTSADGIKGTDVVDGMLAIATNPAFLPITDGDTANQIATGELGAIVSGTWDAAAVQEAFGDGYAACALPTYTCAGNQVPMGSAAGYKMIGVNANSAQVGWAMELPTSRARRHVLLRDRSDRPTLQLASLMRLKQM